MGGDGMGQGRGGFVDSQAERANSLDPNSELSALKRQVEIMSRQMRQQNHKIEKGRRMVARINQESCTGCGACVEMCAFDAIRIEDDKAQADEEKCIGCEACVGVCPVEAIGMA